MAAFVASQRGRESVEQSKKDQGLSGDASDGRDATAPPSLLYAELRALARRYLRGERTEHTLQPTALVHEAWLRLIDAEPGAARDRKQFFALAATMMRRVLVDHARARAAGKRGGRAVRISLSDVEPASESDGVDVLALHEALGGLASGNPRQARVVELRFFCGLDLEEAAVALGVSVDTVKADWRFARAWLNRELTRDRGAE